MHRTACCVIDLIRPNGDLQLPHSMRGNKDGLFFFSSNISSEVLYVVPKSLAYRDCEHQIFNS